MSKYFENLKISALTILMKFLYGSCRWRISGFENVESLLSQNKSFVLAYWHGNMFIPYLKLYKYRFHILAGFHRDADLGVAIGERLGWRFLRGSSSHKGSEVFEQIANLLSTPGNVLAITPDGPKGPAKIPKPGTVRAAQKTGVPIIPVAGRSRHSWGFTNWDTFYITKPFTRIDLKFGDPLHFTLNDDFETCNKTLKLRLDELADDVRKSVNN